MTPSFGAGGRLPWAVWARPRLRPLGLRSAARGDRQWGRSQVLAERQERKRERL